MAGLEVRREVSLAPSDAVAVVVETVTNTKALGRMYNVVQHPSIAPPFLSETTIVDCNGEQGLTQGDRWTALPEGMDPSKEGGIRPTFVFPKAVNAAGEVDATHMTGGPDDVFSYAISSGSKLGWVCATNLEQGLLLGYLFPSEAYPWISLWCCSRKGRPVARGLEFGTTGLHQPFPFCAEWPRIFGRPTFAYIDAGASQRRAYACFSCKVPDGFQGVRSVELGECGQISIVERTEVAQTITMQGGPDLYETLVGRP